MNQDRDGGNEERTGLRMIDWHWRCRRRSSRSDQFDLIRRDCISVAAPLQGPGFLSGGHFFGSSGSSVREFDTDASRCAPTRW
jgi:hypothetical protein